MHLEVPELLVGTISPIGTEAPNLVLTISQQLMTEPLLILGQWALKLAPFLLHPSHEKGAAPAHKALQPTFVCLCVCFDYTLFSLKLNCNWQIPAV